jgi:glycosyltransferase involved in cell wall biosynthesis
MFINSKVSVIVPFVNEWPQLAFTLRSIAENFTDWVDFEIVAVDNYCHEVHQQGKPPDRGHDRWVSKGSKESLYTEHKSGESQFTEGHIKAMVSQNTWLKYVKYDTKLSHWNAKNEGVKVSDGSILLFLDAHVVPSYNILPRSALAFQTMIDEGQQFDTLHLPLTYHVLENRRLSYKLIFDSKSGVAHYTFTRFDKSNQFFIEEVPCMSTCGMFMSRALFDRLGGWPSGLGIYGGGENYINFVLSILGSKKYIYPHGALHHHGDSRGYSFNWEDYHRNRMIATYCFGGEEWLERYQRSLGNNMVTRKMRDQALLSCKKRRERLKGIQVMGIDEWYNSLSDRFDI